MSPISGSVKVIKKQNFQSIDKNSSAETIADADLSFSSENNEEFLDEEFSFNTEVSVQELINKGNEDPLLNIMRKKRKAKSSVTKSDDKEFKTLICEHCTERFSTKSNLIRHRSSQHSEQRKMYQCNLCNIQLTTHAGLKTHIRCLHMNLREYKCEYCGKGFNQKKTLAFHLIRHTNERPYVCEKCGNGFSNPKSLNVRKFYEKL